MDDNNNDDRLFESFFRQSIDADITDKVTQNAISLAKGILDKIKPEWERDIKTRELGLKALELAFKINAYAVEKANEIYEGAFDHELEVHKRWFLPGHTHKQRINAQQRANDAANQCYHMIMGGFISMLQQLAPYFFTADGAAALSALESTTFKLIN